MDEIVAYYGKKDFDSQLEDALPSLRAFARRLARRSQDADDLVQEAALAALAARLSFDGDSIRAWLFTILKNRFLNGLKKGALRREKQSLIAASSGAWIASGPPAPDSGLAGRPALDALDRLSPEFRDAIVAVGVEGLLYKEAAQELGCPVGTVMSRLHRARKACAADLGV